MANVPLSALTNTAAVNIKAAPGAPGTDVTIEGGNGTADADGGNVIISGGSGDGNGIDGTVTIELVTFEGSLIRSGPNGALSLVAGDSGDTGLPATAVLQNGGGDVGGSASVTGGAGDSGGGSVNITAGIANQTGNGGDVVISGGSAQSGATYSSGNIQLKSGYLTDNSEIAFLNLYGATDGNGSHAGSVWLRAGIPALTTRAAGTIRITGGQSVVAEQGGGSVSIEGGEATSALGGYVQLTSGEGVAHLQSRVYVGNDGCYIEAGAGKGGADGITVGVTAGNGEGAGVGGNIQLNPGTGASNGMVMISNLPTADPHVVNALWNDTGTLKISAGV